MMTTDFLPLGYQPSCQLRTQTALTSCYTATAQPQTPLRHSIDAILHKAPSCVVSAKNNSSSKPVLPHIETLRRHDLSGGVVALPPSLHARDVDRPRCMTGFENGDENRGDRSSHSSSESCEDEEEEEEDVVVVDEVNDSDILREEPAEERSPRPKPSRCSASTSPSTSPQQFPPSAATAAQNPSHTIPSDHRTSPHPNAADKQVHQHIGVDKVRSAFRPIVRPWLADNGSVAVSDGVLATTGPGDECFRHVCSLQMKRAQSGMSPLDAITMLRKQSSAFKVAACNGSRRSDMGKQQVMMASTTKCSTMLSSPAIESQQPLPSTLASWFSWLRSGGLQYPTHPPQRFHPGAPPCRGTVLHHPANGPAPTPHAPRYNCEACGKSYSTFGGLSKHKQFHCSAQVKKDFRCKFCDKSYSSLGALKMHIRTHTLPCKCTVCGKAFSRPWLLQGHLRTHTGEKPFSCPHCARAFADRSNLRAHLQTHSDVKKYSCRHCAKTFSRMSLLMKHRETSCLALHS